MGHVRILSGHRRGRERGGAGRQRTVGLLLLLAACSAGGCFEYREDIWLYGDHSGRLEGHIRVPHKVWEEYQSVQPLRPGQMEAVGRRIADRVEGAQVVAFQELSTSGNHRASWTFTFDTADALGALLAEVDAAALTLLPLPADALPVTRPRSVVDRLGRLTTVERRLPALPDVARDEYLARALAKQYARFRVHTPEPIVGSRDFLLGSDGRTATWEPALDAIARDGLTLQVSYRAPFPVARVVAIVGSLLFGVIGIWGFAYLHMRRGVPEPEVVLPSRVTPVAEDSGEFTDEWSASGDDDGAEG